jgi:hypothetical protein
MKSQSLALSLTRAKHFLRCFCDIFVGEEKPRSLLVVMLKNFICSLLLSIVFYLFFFLGVERLWSPLSITQQGSSHNVLQRLQSFRCLLDQRGIAAAPLLNLSSAYAFGRVAPSEPGSCFRQ